MMIFALVFLLGFLGGAAAVYFWPREKQLTSEVEDEVMTAAKRLVGEVEKSFADMSGEFKRSQVMRALINIFPTKKAQDLALAIELAVRK
jgi:hypothetical protein